MTSKGPENSHLIDMFDRSISYLRLSLTDQCNLRCLYCTPKSITDKLASVELLSYEEILRVVRLAVEMGVKKIRLTGGEPLVRHDITTFIRGLAEINGLEDIRLTTNGVLLADYAEELYRAGIRKLNISLDTLRPDRFREITGGDFFDRVWRGITVAKEMGFAPIKINVVAMNGINDDEFIDFARLSLSEPYQIRFIEFMPMGKDSAWDKEKYISADTIRKRLETIGPLKPLATGGMEGPARVYQFAGAVGKIGFISPISHHFCDKCNRLRLTSEGKLRSCLLTDQETDLKKIIRSNGSDKDIEEALIATILNKPKGHKLNEKKSGNCHGQMSRIGG
ncbi:GTP 3',8-cyclase MoaA [Thermodesulfobacteriota bacterium]